jgi:hypothetical protein
MMGRSRSALFAALALVACSSLPVPRTGPHGGDDEQRELVPYPPPPGKVEIILDRPPTLKHPVWVDGQWLWMGRRWTWKDGGWEENREGEYYAPPKTARIWDGTLVHYPGLWKKDASASSPAVSSPAASSSAAPEPSAPAPTAVPGPEAR